MALIFNMSMFPKVKFSINSLVSVNKKQKIVVGYAYVDGEIIYVLSPDVTYKDKDLEYSKEPDLKLVTNPEKEFVTKYSMGDKTNSTEYIGGILRTSNGENVLYFLTNTEFEPETIQWIEIE